MDPERMKAGIAEVFDRAAATYEQTGVDFFGPPGRRLVEIAEIGTGERVLDLGCGRGAVSFPAAEAVGTSGRVIGVDFAPGMVEGTAAEARERGLVQLEVYVADADAPPGASDSFDVVTAGFTLFFLPDLPSALKRYLSLLRPGGRLAFSWFGDDDERWNSVYAAAWAHLAEEHALPDRRAGDSPWGDVQSLQAALTMVGYTAATTVEEDQLVTFHDADQWYAWTWSHSMRSRWESMSHAQRSAARHDAEAAMDEVRRRDGSLEQIGRFRYTTAHRPRMQGGNQRCPPSSRPGPNPTSGPVGARLSRRASPARSG